MHMDWPSLPIGRAYARAFRACNTRVMHIPNQNGPLAKPGSRLKSPFCCKAILVRAFRKQGHQDHQVRKRKQPLIGAQAGGFRRPRDEAQMTALGKIVHVLDANPGQAGNLGIGEDLLARLYRNHGPAPLLRHLTAHTYLDAESIVCAALFLSNSRSVLPTKNELSSTFSLKPAIRPFFHTFSYCGGCSTGLTIGGLVEKIFYFSKLVTVFGRVSEIFPMPYFVPK